MQQPFAPVPDQEEIAGMERRLRFLPTVNPSPRTLDAEQVAHYNERGYVTGISIFSADEIAQVRTQFDGILAATIAAGGDSYSISTAHRTYAVAWDLLTEPRIVACVKDLLGENVIGWGCHFFCKMPNDGKVVSWHQDASYWPLSDSKTVTVWLAIDDADIENACMRFLPGTHTLGHITYRLSEQDEANVLNQTVENIEQYGAPVYNELRAGQISMHSDLLLHGSEANMSPRRRCALTLRYCAADVRAGLGWNEKGVHVSGGDPSGHWANQPRPVAP
ncbi:MAG: phytanoyl-CoA dioxygenase family protein [Bryobacterales bacterium]|nr:phytanoyl-CoA dioxygenase family protein [Bryobacterales bacterium]